MDKNSANEVTRSQGLVATGTRDQGLASGHLLARDQGIGTSGWLGTRDQWPFTGQGPGTRDQWLARDQGPVVGQGPGTRDW